MLKQFGSFDRKIQISKDLMEASRGMLTLGVITARVKVRKFDKTLWEEMVALGENIKKEFNSSSVEEIAQIKALRETYKTLGLKVSDYKGSNESLLKRILSGKGLYQINSVVDVNNLISVKSLRSLGSYDLSKLQGNIIFRRGLPDETYTGTTKRPLVLNNLPILSDDQGPFGSPTSDSSRALIQEETSDVMTVIFSFDGTVSLRKEMHEVEDLLKKYADASDLSLCIVGESPVSLQASLDESEKSRGNVQFLPSVEQQQKKNIEIHEEIKKVEEKGETKLSLQAKKSENFSQWYTDVIIKGDLIEYYDISGCYILRPHAFAIWEGIQKFFDNEIKKVNHLSFNKNQAGVENAYFPLFVSQKTLFKEKEHLEGFSPEVAWVTRYSNTELAEPIAIRPTSETIMYGAYSKWISSHRDLPLKLNQWTNVVRWEFKDPTPFIRTREFLWQEGHTAHATKEEADTETWRALGNFQYEKLQLELYRRLYEEILAIPVIKGVKTDAEKFPGALFTTSVEAYIPENSRGIQAATSHQLGQSFAKMFNIQYLDQHNEKQLVWQCSWGVTTRSIGILVMVHGDDKGLVLPPKIAQYQVVIIPILSKDTDDETLFAKCNEIQGILTNNSVRAKVDLRDNYSPGWKFNHWEMKGIPLRVEVGKKEIEEKQIKVVKRLTGEKLFISFDELAGSITKQLAVIQTEMFYKAKTARDARIKSANNWEEFMKIINEGGMALTPWCMEADKEADVKLKCSQELKDDPNANLKGAPKTLCIPLEQEEIKSNEKCFFTNKPALKRVLWGRSY